jgi:hypothetical protein
MTTHGIASIWLAEIGRRLRAGETKVRLKDVEEATGARVEAWMDAEQLWASLWRHIQAEGREGHALQRTRRGCLRRSRAGNGRGIQSGGLAAERSRAGMGRGLLLT